MTTGVDVRGDDRIPFVADFLIRAEARKPASLVSLSILSGRPGVCLRTIFGVFPRGVSGVRMTTIFGFLPLATGFLELREADDGDFFMGALDLDDLSDVFSVDENRWLERLVEVLCGVV